MVKAETYEGPGAPVELAEGCILGIGNPLLDVSAVVPTELFEKYGVKLNDAILAEEKQMPLYEELVKDYPVEYIAGGATQNSIRVAQWMSQSKGATGFLGSIGQDDFGKQLTKACTDAGVAAHYYETTEQPTGVCAVLIHEGERSLVTKLDAANCYKHSHTKSEAIQAVIEKAKIFYIASFFLTVPEGPETIEAVAKHAAEESKIFAMNLSAPFLIDFFSEQMNKALPYTDFVFSNETEAETFAKKQGWDCDLAEAALRLSAMPKVSGARPRTVVFSQGAEPTIVAFNGTVTYYPVPKLNTDLLVDTNGAGDAFVGGFLARLAAGMPLAECVRSGHYAARVVIQRSGCSVPPQPDI
ncbi:Adenosine kinase [Hondaea fermentalgiana]|uniref:Adenosine kinase n=1 Tax=Hondaea fermentalgiana TaxID=2315210 RepID=A0A2R5G930_9STRA|nr:Adenosine kinase [Hondaea fermentalgiana]|eukprot:GBG27045.1 Adenosine kinase [Hondaea fermentalgiana]